MANNLNYCTATNSKFQVTEAQASLHKLTRVLFSDKQSMDVDENSDQS